MERPSHLECGPYRHKVDWVFLKDGEGGDYQMGRVRVNTRIPLCEQKVVFVHEWLHSLIEQMGVDLDPLDNYAKSLGFVAHDEDGLEEMLVRRLAPILLDSMRRNRDALDWALDVA